MAAWCTRCPSRYGKSSAEIRASKRSVRPFTLCPTIGPCEYSPCRMNITSSTWGSYCRVSSRGYPGSRWVIGVGRGYHAAKSSAAPVRKSPPRASSSAVHASSPRTRVGT